MAPKKAKAGPHVFSEVERAFYELQLTDCNRKLARLRKTADDYEIRNEELQKAYNQIDEDRADTIAFLKKNLTAKTEEIKELKEKLRYLEELTEEETTKFHETVTELERNFTKMKDQLTSENKLLAGKLNTLEEFRAIRDDLMKKFDKQEHAYEDQELNYKRIIYNNEKKFVKGKDKLKREMEERLLNLAQQFQDASELRIAASTHRVIRENIALNNQLDSLLMTHTKVAEENDKLREDERASRCAKEVAEEERDKTINKSIVQLKVIDQLTTAFEDMKKQKALYEKKQFNIERNQTKIQKLTKDNESLLLRVRILEQNLHATLSDQNKSVVESAKILRERETFMNILKESAFAVDAALKMDNWCILDPSREIMDREIVLKKILDVINQYRDATYAESMESLVSHSKVYEKGDLGFEVEKSFLSKPLGGFKSFEDKRSSLSITSGSSSNKSLKTIPSFKVMSINEEASPPTPKDSLSSFAVTSYHSSANMSADIADGIKMDEVSKMLEMSRMDVQRSLMAELAISQLSKKISAVASSISSTSVKEALRDSTRDEHHEESEFEPTQNTVEPTQDTDDPTQDTVEPAQDSSEPTQNVSEPSGELAEPVVIGHEDDKKKKKTNAE